MCDLPRTVAREFTLTPGPSPQGGGALALFYLAQTFDAFGRNAATLFPSTFWEGVRGGGIEPTNLDHA